MSSSSSLLESLPDSLLESLLAGRIEPFVLLEYFEGEDPRLIKLMWPSLAARPKNF